MLLTVTVSSLVCRYTRAVVAVDVINAGAVILAGSAVTLVDVNCNISKFELTITMN